MKKVLTTLIIMCCFVTIASSQSIVLTSGTIDFMKDETVCQFTFTYNEMLVGKMTEAEYVSKKVNDYNEKEPGRGDLWQKAWIEDRTTRFEPKFLELFNKYINEKGISSVTEGANYQIEINTDFSEPGWNVGVMRQNASVDLSCKVIKVATGEKVATIKIRNASANNFWGTDFDSGYRLQESYSKAGREFAKFIIKKAKLK